VEFGWHRYGERKQQVEDWSGLSFQTCENYGGVCRRFEPPRRREVLSFGHHETVAYLPPDKADALLDWCLEDTETPRSRRELRDEVRQRTAPPKTVVHLTIDPIDEHRSDLPPEKWTPGYAYLASACCGVM
jgi:hypothetical protein